MEVKSLVHLILIFGDNVQNLIFIISIFLAVACTTRTQYGRCIGVADTPDQALEYELSLWNAFVAGLFSETLIVPLYTVAYDIKCPVGYKK